MSLKKFLTKHAGELSKLTGILSDVIRAVPMDRQDKNRLRDGLNDLDKAAASIAASAKKLTEKPVKIDRALLTDIVRELLPEIVEAVAKKVNETAADAVQEKHEGDESGVAE